MQVRVLLMSGLCLLVAGRCAPAKPLAAQLCKDACREVGLPVAEYDHPPVVIWMLPVVYPGFSNRPIAGSARFGILVGVDGGVKQVKYIDDVHVPVGWVSEPKTDAGWLGCQWVTWSQILSSAKGIALKSVCDPATLQGNPVEAWALVRLDVTVSKAVPPWPVGHCDWQQLPVFMQ